MKLLPEVGDRVKMVGTMPDEPDPIPFGSEGTVVFVNKTSFGTQIDVDWDNGRALMLLDEDPYAIL